MKFFGLFVLVLAALAMLMGSAEASPKGAGGLKKAFKGARKVVGVVGAIGTGAEIADRIRNRHNG